MEEYILKHAEEGYVKAVDIKPTAITFTYTPSREYAGRFSGIESWNVVAKLAGLSVEPATRYYVKNRNTDTYLKVKTHLQSKCIDYRWITLYEDATSFKCEEDAKSVRAALVLLGVVNLDDWVVIEEVP
jgi:hypothetical protein